MSCIARQSVVFLIKYMTITLGSRTRECWDGLLDLVYPPLCVLCDNKLVSAGERATRLCAACSRQIKKIRPPYCVMCGRSLQGHTENVDRCWECCGRRCHYDRSWSCALYEGTLREAIHRFKYSGKVSLLDLFSGLLSNFLAENSGVHSGMDAVIAVPLHSTKLREREFNQAQALAAVVAKQLRIIDASRCIRRSRPTRAQNELDRNQRFKNVRGAFAVADPRLVNGKNVLIVDDLYTTGATLDECGRVLRAAGAQRIHCITVARGA